MGRPEQTKVYDLNCYESIAHLIINRIIEEEINPYNFMAPMCQNYIFYVYFFSISFKSFTVDILMD